MVREGLGDVPVEVDELEGEIVVVSEADIEAGVAMAAVEWRTSESLEAQATKTPWTPSMTS